MNWREFITLLGGAAAWPMPVRAQQSAKLPTIGFMGTTTPSVWQPWTAAFVQRLRELGWIEGRTVAIEYRWAEGRADRWGEIATEFARTQGRHRCHGWRRSRERRKAGDADHSDRLPVSE